MKTVIILILLNVFIISFFGEIKLVNSITEKEWWQHATIYQIYPRSLKDSDGDGVGDIQGIISKLPHLKEIGVNAIWMSPMFQSANIDFGYDVINFFEIHHEYGTMEDFDEFMEAANELNIRILLDFVPNHSSDENQWFINSANRVEGYEDYYTWHDGTNDGNDPPNNWVSVFGGPAWTKHPIRQQWYLHQFFPGQPDLNYRNPDVLEEMNGVIRFWLEKGVSGFRVDAVNHLFEDLELRDEPRNDWNDDPNSYDYLDHIYTKDLPEVYDMIYNWRTMIDEWSMNNEVETKIFVTEAYASRENTMRYYKSPDTDQIGSMPYNFELIYLDNPNDFSAQRIKGGIAGWFDYMPPGFTAPWASGSHDHRRVGSRLGSGHVGIMNTINLMLPGTSITYYGEEIGMTDNYDFEISDSRDVNRTPMQWDSSISAGFSTNNITWLPINSNYETLNVEALKEAERSDYHHFIELTTLRNYPTIIFGDINMKSITSDIFAFIRELPNHETYAIVTNSGSNQTVDLSIFINLPDTLEIVASSKDSAHRIGDTVITNQLQMNAFDALVLKTIIDVDTTTTTPNANATIPSTTVCPSGSHSITNSNLHLSFISMVIALIIILINN